MGVDLSEEKLKDIQVTQTIIADVKRAGQGSTAQNMILQKVLIVYNAMHTIQLKSQPPNSRQLKSKLPSPRRPDLQKLKENVLLMKTEVVHG